MDQRHTICRLCSALCPILVRVENEKLISAKRKAPPGLETDYSCPKLKAAPDIVYSEKRLKKPLIKDAGGSNNGWKEASWPQALDWIADKLTDLKSRYGAETVCWMRGMAADWGAPWDYARRFMNAFGSPNVIGNGAVCHVARELAHVVTYGAMTSADCRNAKCILIFGKNDHDTNPAAYETNILAKKDGAKLIVIDPVRTKLAEMADVWLQIKPGADGLLAMSMLNVMVTEELYDPQFIRKWTLGFNELKQTLPPYAPERIARRIWLAAEDIRHAARLYARTKPACLVEGNGLDMHVNVSQNTRAVCILRALSGNIDIKGGNPLPQPIPMRDIHLTKEGPQKIDPISFERPLFNSFNPQRGDHTLSSITDAILQEKPYSVRALIVQASNPVVTMANAKRFIQALKKLELLVVVDLFMTRTTELAHIVLPTTTCFEKTQLNLGAYCNPANLQNQVIDWIGDSWPDWKITFELAKRMGFEKEFPWHTIEEAIDYQLAPSGLTVQKLRKNPDGMRCEELTYKKYEIKGFNTPSGKIEFYSEILKENGYPPLPSFTVGEENSISFYNEKDRFPFIGISGARPQGFVHSQLHHIPQLLKQEPEPLVDIHPQDANRLKIEDGDKLKIETPKGRIVIKAKISNVVRPGLVRIAWGWGELIHDCNLNELTDDTVRDPLTGTPSNRCFMCNVVKIN
jgi:anaerobic selenocysteine-containing dehydrogenase